MGDEENFAWDVPFSQSEAAVSDLELEEQIADILGEDDVFEETSASTFESDLRAERDASTARWATTGAPDDGWSWTSPNSPLSQSAPRPERRSDSKVEAAVSSKTSSSSGVRMSAMVSSSSRSETAASDWEKGTSHA